MTTTSLVEFVNGVADAQYEFQNSWGGAARIWGSLFSKYILHATSICENPWIEWSEELDESVPYDIAKGDKHWFVFESLSDFAAVSEA